MNTFFHNQSRAVRTPPPRASSSAIRAEGGSVPTRSGPEASHVHFVGIGGTGVLVKRPTDAESSFICIVTVSQRSPLLNSFLSLPEGLGPLASLAQLRGWSVTGSDRTSSSPQLDLLSSRGIPIFIGHSAAHVQAAFSNPFTNPSSSGPGLQYLVASSAVPADNPEIVEARARGVPVLKREQWLRKFSEDMTTLAVSGTHGKTTSTALLAYVLWKDRVQRKADGGLKVNPPLMAVVGGAVPQFPGGGGGALYWEGDGDSTPDFVIEADEYDNAYLGLCPNAAIVLNVEHDHVDCFPTEEAVLQSFEGFVRNLEPDGLLLICGDDAGAQRLRERLASSSRASTLAPISFGFGAQCDLVLVDEPNSSGRRRWAVTTRSGAQLGSFSLRLLGRHNASNAAAALSFGALVLARREQHPHCSWAELLEAGPLESLREHFGRLAQHAEEFEGTSRRFQLASTITLKDGRRIHVYDDYAHHPTEIRAVVAAAREAHGSTCRLVLVFQPHTYTRLSQFLSEFVGALVSSRASYVSVMPVFGARESGGPGDVLVKELCDRVQAGGVPCEAIDAADARAAASRIMNREKMAASAGQPPLDTHDQMAADSVILVLGAGDSPEFTRML